MSLTHLPVHQPVKTVTREVTRTTVSDSSLSIAITNNVGSVLASAAWPIAAVLIAHFFKEEIAAMIARVRSLKALGVEASLDILIQETLLPIPAGTIDEPAAEGGSPTAGALPVEIITASWRNVEDALNEVSAKLPGSKSHLSLRSKMNEIAALDATPTELPHRIIALMDIRNRAIHNASSNISEDSIKLYQENAISVINELRRLLQSTNG